VKGLIIDMKNGVYPRPAIRKGCIRIDSIDDIDFTHPRAMKALSTFYTHLLQKGIANGTPTNADQSNSLTYEVENAPTTAHNSPCFTNCA
jgi:hypothetical protein